MNTQGSWKATPPGQLARFIGGVKFAVPVLALSAAAMIWGTWIDSTEEPGTAMREVYGSWWFVALMGLICASLILSVAVRYPWRRKHVGFIIVHASLVALIIIGFFTMLTKEEGRIVLTEGEADNRMQMQDNWLEIVEHTDAGFLPVAHGVVGGADEVRLLDNATGKPVRTLTIVDRWDNSEMVSHIVNDSESPSHAVEVRVGTNGEIGGWAFEQPIHTSAPSAGSFAIWVAPAGQDWTPPEGVAAIVLVDPQGAEHAIPDAGTPLGDSGWTFTSLQRFERGTLGGGGEGLRERESGAPNPATQVVLTHADGSVERQIAFASMPDSPFPRQLEGQTASGWKLTYRGESLAGPVLAVMRDAGGHVRALYAAPDGTRERFESDGTWPWQLTVAGVPVAILQDLDRARSHEVLEQRPGTGSDRPVLVVSTGMGGEEVRCRWRDPTPVQVGGSQIVLHYGPSHRPLPFTIRLNDFVKMDYPGSDMAMAYESHVTVTPEHGQPLETKIHMNHPYKQGGWKVYQSGFQGDNVTFLQVTKDPGLAPMYLACTTLCIGILVTFYSRSLSWGHPDIPVPFPASAETDAKA